MTERERLIAETLAKHYYERAEFNGMEGYNGAALTGAFCACEVRVSCHDRDEMIHAMNAHVASEIAAALAEVEWIPVEERLPEIEISPETSYGCYLVRCVDENELPWTDIAGFNYAGWSIGNPIKNDAYITVTHWRPLPAPPTRKEGWV